ncbi:MAG TPA: TetR/AcrR family transcriptional regulator [Paenibacillaceae bacterium]|nr:TetR/AcrR family transcriptional regulator [Paenibacillaceae bacterium]
MGTIERKEKEKNLRRADIIGAAEALFFEKGYDRVTMDEIAKKAEFSKRTLYSYFESKEQLLHAIMYRAYSTLNSLINVELNNKEKLNGLQKLKLLGGVYINFINLYPKYFEMIAYYNGSKCELPADDEYRVMSDQEGDKTLQNLVRFIYEGIQDGSVRPDIDVKKTAFVLYANIIGIASLVLNKASYLYEHRLMAEDFVEEMFGFMERSIAKTII